MGRKSTITPATLALAYELRSEGVRWSLIEKGLGVKTETLRDAINVAKEKGLRK